MKRLIITALLFLMCAVSYAAPDTLWYNEHQGGVNGCWLESRFVYVEDAVVTLEMWQQSLAEFKAQRLSIQVDNTDPIVLELMRCPNSLNDKPRYAVVDGAITPTSEVKNIIIPAGFTAVNDDGTLR